MANQQPRGEMTAEQQQMLEERKQFYKGSVNWGTYSIVLVSLLTFATVLSIVLGAFWPIASATVVSLIGTAIFVLFQS